jgi:hypothetical protein
VAKSQNNAKDAAGLSDLETMQNGGVPIFLVRFRSGTDAGIALVWNNQGV